MHEEIKKEAYMYGVQMGAEYSKEVGKTDLSTMSVEEILTFAECVCKGYHMKLIELEKKYYSF